MDLLLLYQWWEICPSLNVQQETLKSLCASFQQMGTGNLSHAMTVCGSLAYAALWWTRYDQSGADVNVSVMRCFWTIGTSPLEPCAFQTLELGCKCSFGLIVIIWVKVRKFWVVKPAECFWMVEHPGNKITSSCDWLGLITPSHHRPLAWWC